MQMSEASIQQNTSWQKIKAGWVGNADKWCEFILVLLIHSGEKCSWSILIWYVIFWSWKRCLKHDFKTLFRNFLWSYPLESGKKGRLKLNETLSEQANNFVQYEMKFFHHILRWYWELSLLTICKHHKLLFLCAIWNTLLQVLFIIKNKQPL